MTTPNQTLHLFLMAALCYSIKCQKANLDPPAVLNTPSQRPFPIGGPASPGLSAFRSDSLILAKEWNSLRAHCRAHKAVGHLEHTTSCVPSPPHSRRRPARPSELSGQRHRSPHPSGGHGAKGVPLNTFYTHLLTPRERSGIISLCVPKRHQAASTQTLSHVGYPVFTVGESSLVDRLILEIPSGRRCCDEI